MSPQTYRSLLRLLALPLAALFIQSCGITDPTGPKRITVTKGNANGAAFVNNGTQIEIHLTLLNESEIKADQLDLEFSFQFGTSTSSQTVYYKDQHTTVLRAGQVVEYDLYLSESQLTGFNRFTDLSLIRLSGIGFYNFQQDATRAIDDITYSITIYQK